jgi:AFG3 family protein
VEVRKIIDESYNRTKQLLTDHREDLEKVAQELLSKEVLFMDDLKRLIGPRPFGDPESTLITSATEEKESGKVDLEKKETEDGEASVVTEEPSNT